MSRSSGSDTRKVSCQQLAINLGLAPGWLRAADNKSFAIDLPINTIDDEK